MTKETRTHLPHSPYSLRRRRRRRLGDEEHEQVVPQDVCSTYSEREKSQHGIMEREKRGWEKREE
jgi:hypothetical protein